MSRESESGLPIEPVYGPEALDGLGPGERLGRARRATRTPAASTRRCTPAARGRCASTPGFGTATESNERYHQLVEAGTGGLSVAFDLPTQMGYDSDDPIAHGEVGKVGVAIDSIEDMRTLFDGIPLGQGVHVDDHQRARPRVLLLLYQLVAEEQGVDPSQLTGTIQNDVLKEYIARGTYIYPPKPSLRLVSRHLRLLPQGDPAVEHHLHLRLPHGRGRGDARAGDRVHPGQRHGVRPGRARRRAGRRRLRAPAVVLLRGPHHAARGGREVPRRPADLGPDDARRVRRAGPEVD